MQNEVDSVLLTKRIVGKYTQGHLGPLIICMAGIHGNEPAGVIALSRVFEILEQVQPPFKGTFVGLAGNLPALQKGIRFTVKDLNRCWTEENVRKLSLTSDEVITSVEDAEQKELIQLLEENLSQPHKDFLFIDLHTTSAAGGVFTICSDAHVTKSIAVNLQVPVIIGLDEVLGGTTLNYFQTKNLSAIGFEAGQHNDPDSVENMISVLMVVLEAMGNLDESDIPGFPLFEIRLGKLGHNLPEILKFRYRFSVEVNNSFEMLPGFQNFQRVEKGTLLAHYNGEEVKAEFTGMLLMPLYQKQGEDGFFLVEPMSIDDIY